MKKDEEILLDYKTQYLITTGNAGNIKIFFDNEKYGRLGKKGEVLNLYKINTIFQNN